MNNPVSMSPLSGDGSKNIQVAPLHDKSHQYFVVISGTGEFEFYQLE